MLHPNKRHRYFIYGLYSSNGIFYVGRTSLKLKERMYTHLSFANRKLGNPTKNEMVLAGAKIKTIQRVVCRPAEASRLEKHWINLLKEKGATLYNGTHTGRPKKQKTI